jgi:hypothetical protein
LNRHRPLPGSRPHPKDSTATERSSHCGTSTELIPVMGQNRESSDRFLVRSLSVFLENSQIGTPRSHREHRDICGGPEAFAGRVPKRARFPPYGPVQGVAISRTVDPEAFLWEIDGQLVGGVGATHAQCPLPRLKAPLVRSRGPRARPRALADELCDEEGRTGVRCRDSLFAYAIKSGTVLAGNSGLTSMTFGARIKGVTGGAMPRITLKLEIVVERHTLVAAEGMTNRSV